jgi:hypothetical protein
MARHDEHPMEAGKNQPVRALSLRTPMTGWQHDIGALFAGNIEHGQKAGIVRSVTGILAVEHSLESLGMRSSEINRREQEMPGQVRAPEQRELKQLEGLVVRLVHYLASRRWPYEPTSHEQVARVLLVSAQVRLAPFAEQSLTDALLHVVRRCGLTAAAPQGDHPVLVVVQRAVSPLGNDVGFLEGRPLATQSTDHRRRAAPISPSHRR